MKPLRTVRFQHPARSVWFGRARLFSDRVELTGWTLGGRYRRIIPLARIRRAEWWSSDARGTNFALHLDDGSTCALRLRRGAADWKFEIDALLGRSTFSPTHLPDDQTQQDAAA